MSLPGHSTSRLTWSKACCTTFHSAQKMSPTSRAVGKVKGSQVSWSLSCLHDLLADVNLAVQVQLRRPPTPLLHNQRI